MDKKELDNFDLEPLGTGLTLEEALALAAKGLPEGKKIWIGSESSDTLVDITPVINPAGSV